MYTSVVNSCKDDEVKIEVFFKLKKTKSNITSLHKIVESAE